MGPSLPAGERDYLLKNFLNNVLDNILTLTNKMQQFNFLVIGGGLAGLSFALRVADYGSVAVLFKKERVLSSSAWAQGGVAAVSRADDHFALHIEDTKKAGAGLCNPEAVEIVVKEGPQRVKELIQFGAQFDTIVDKDNNVQFDLAREGGHSKRRIYHSADATGWEIQRVLLEKSLEHPNITFFDNCSAIDLITSQEKVTADRKVLGAYVLKEDGAIEAFVAQRTMMATGGAGKVYLYTSNPDIATGDGVAMCHRAGATVLNMEFFQFHPTCLYHPKAKSFLITEAMRGEGAVLRRINGERFMDAYHPDAELAPRDVVARAIDKEMKIHGEEHVYLDITHKSKDFILQHFPTIATTCEQYGIDITTEQIPVVPAAHYCCGGVRSDLHGRSQLQNLFVAGEVSCTGLHGANRLASNSLLEAMVFAARAAKVACSDIEKNYTYPPVPEWDSGSAVDSDETVMLAHNWDEIRRFMWNYVGIVRSEKRLERALNRSSLLREEIEKYYWDFTVTHDLLELRNLSLVADLVIRSAIQRKESRGLHYNLDYPDTLPGAQDTEI